MRPTSDAAEPALAAVHIEFPRSRLRQAIRAQFDCPVLLNSEPQSARIGPGQACALPVVQRAPGELSASGVHCADRAVARAEPVSTGLEEKVEEILFTATASSASRPLTEVARTLGLPFPGTLRRPALQAGGTGLRFQDIYRRHTAGPGGQLYSR